MCYLAAPNKIEVNVSDSLNWTQTSQDLQRKTVSIYFAHHPVGWQFKLGGPADPDPAHSHPAGRLAAPAGLVHKSEENVVLAQHLPTLPCGHGPFGRLAWARAHGALRPTRAAGERGLAKRICVSTS